MDDLDPAWVAATRRRDLLQTLVMVGIALTPAWLLPQGVALPWMVVVGVLAVPAVVASWRHAPWQPTPQAELQRLLTHLALSPEQRFCDLGSGDGRMVLWVARATGAHCVGLEISALPWLVSRVRLAVQGSDRTEVRLADLYRADLSEFDVVYVWGTAYSVGTERFAARMRQALRPGARLVSYHTPVVGLEALTVDEGGQRPIWVYEMPAG